MFSVHRYVWSVVYVVFVMIFKDLFHYFFYNTSTINDLKATTEKLKEEKVELINSHEDLVYDFHITAKKHRSPFFIINAY